MVFGSNVSSCHISTSLTAVLGRKLQPTSQGWLSYHCQAFAAGQRPSLVPFADGLGEWCP